VLVEEFFRSLRYELDFPSKANNTRKSSLFLLLLYEEISGSFLPTKIEFIAKLLKKLFYEHRGPMI